MAKAVESFDLSEYDVVIASHSAFVHGAITKPETKFIIYYHTPARYMWDRTNEYKKEIKWNTGIKRWLLNSILYKLRMWDYQASQRHDITLANSLNVAQRLKKYYHLDSQVVYPNVDIRRFQTPMEKAFDLPFSNYTIIISALTEFKRVDIALHAFTQMPDKNLVIVWDGNYREILENMVPPNTSNIKFVGRKDEEELIYLLQNAKSLIFCGEEDFGIVPIESFAAGKPVFAYYGGGLKETMLPKVTGDFFYDKNWGDFVSKFITFDREVGLGKYVFEKIINHAENFHQDCFEQSIREIVGA